MKIRTGIHFRTFSTSLVHDRVGECIAERDSQGQMCSMDRIKAVSFHKPASEPLTIHLPFEACQASSLEHLKNNSDAKSVKFLSHALAHAHAKFKVLRDECYLPT